VALEVPVSVNGARAVAGSNKREPFSEATKTVLIFGHGAVLRLSSAVAPGQLLFLTNDKTKKEVVCQVVNSKNYSGMSGYVELEFTEPVSGFWGMRFPAATQHHSSEAALASSAAARDVTAGSVVESKAPVTTPAIRPETKSTNSSSPRVPESVFPGQAVSKNEAAAPQSGSPNFLSALPPPTPSSSLNLASPEVVEAAKPTKVSTATPLVTPKTSAPPPSQSMLDSDEIKMPSWLEPLARNAAAASAALPEIGSHDAAEEFGQIPAVDDLSITEITDTPEGATRGIPVSSFGTHFLADEQDALSEEGARPTKSDKKFLFGAIAAGGLLLIGAGGWYVRQSTDNVAANNSATNAAPVITTAKVDNNRVNNERTPSQSQARASVVEKPSAKFTDVSTPATVEPNASSATSKSTKFVDSGRANLNATKNIATVDSASDVAATPEVAAPAPPKKQNLGSVKLSAPTIVNKAAGPVAAEEALNFEPSQPAAGMASGFGGSTSRQPVAPSSGPDLKSATLISSVAPIYPVMARNQRISGAVTIDALVDATGRVTGMTVISGPALLQESAKDALRRWKYEPAQLHGRPVPTHMTVTLQFKLQ
jgi:TonB family protein